MCVCVCVCVLATQSCTLLCDSMKCSLLASSVHVILQAKIVQWVTIPYSRGPLQPGMGPWSPALQADSSTFEPPFIFFFNFLSHVAECLINHVV